MGFHDSSAAIIGLQDKKLKDIEIYLSERFTKVKHQGLFPFAALKELTKNRPTLLSEIPQDHIGLNCIGSHAQKVEQETLRILPLYSEKIQHFGFQKLSPTHVPDIKFITHHLAHAYSAMALCPYSQAIIVVSDGMGNYQHVFGEDHPEAHLKMTSNSAAVESLSVYLMDQGRITPLYKFFSQSQESDSQRVFLNNGLGNLFESVSRLIFKNWQQSGKVMGLAAYGTPIPINDRAEFTRSLMNVEADPSKDKNAFDAQDPQTFQVFANLAASVQTYFEEFMIKFLKDLKMANPRYENLILVGGCALNCLLNHKIIEQKIYEQVFVPPYANDEGVSLGVALKLAQESGDWIFSPTPIEEMHASMGPPGSDTQVQEHLVPDYFKAYQISKPENLTHQVACILESGSVIAWIQGRSEVGPRALGHRSLLVRADKSGVKAYLNNSIKFREQFRPYGSTILAEHVQDYFEVEANYTSPFMNFAPQVRSDKKELLKEVTHPDGSSRIQTLSQKQNPCFYDLIKKFKEFTGLPLLLNTSLNIMGQPMVEDIQDAFDFFKQSEVKVLVYGNYLIQKELK